jgi:hypothetical protein
MGWRRYSILVIGPQNERAMLFYYLVIIIAAATAAVGPVCRGTIFLPQLRPSILLIF